MSLFCKENCLHKLFDIFNRVFIVDDLAYLNIIIYTFPWSTFYTYTKSVQSCLCGFVSLTVLLVASVILVTLTDDTVRLNLPGNNAVRPLLLVKSTVMTLYG